MADVDAVVQDSPQAPGGGYFIVRNSWEPDWGNKGHCRISYKMTTEFASDAYVLQAYDEPFTSTYEVTFPPGAPTAGSGSAEPDPGQIAIVAPKPKPTPTSEAPAAAAPPDGSDGE